jgi:hypothetical protein
MEYKGYVISVKHIKNRFYSLAIFENGYILVDTCVVAGSPVGPYVYATDWIDAWITDNWRPF